MTWIAAKTRAISIHIIAATQHPDEKVISGIIKASFPIRGPFKIVGETCSKIILNAAGAEDFLENIDMLLDDGKGNIQRLQGGCLEYEGNARFLDGVRNAYDTVKVQQFPKLPAEEPAPVPPC